MNSEHKYDVMPYVQSNIQQTADDLITEEVHEIISHRPHWMIRKGNMVFFVVLVFLLSLTWFIHYPDIVTASSRIVALDAPRQVMTRTDGRLMQLFARNEEMVSAGQQLAFLETTADYRQVKRLESWIAEVLPQINAEKFDYLASHPVPVLPGLGELQSGYQEFQAVGQQTLEILPGGYYQRKKAALQKDLAYLSQLKTATLEQKRLLREDQQLQAKEFAAYEKLASEKVIAPMELNQYKSRLIGKDQGLEQMASQATNNEMASHGKVKEMLELDKAIFDQKQQFYSSLLNLKNAVDKWKQQYVLSAPVSGKLLFNSSIQENEWIATGQVLFYVQPLNSNYYAELVAGQQGLGKIERGQPVMLKIASFPAEEFGYVEGVVDYISPMPNRRDSFQVKAQLPNGLVTNYRKTVLFKNELMADAEIITADRRLIDRFFAQLMKVLQR